MSLLVTNDSKILMLKIILNKVASDGGAPNSTGNRRLKLFVNNLVPTSTTLINNLTECSSLGYEMKTLSGQGWNVILDTEGATSASYSEQTFDVQEQVSIYGYYVTNYDGTELLWVERFSGAPYTLPVGGGSIGINLNFTLS
jgi:hypothetical protein